MSHNAAADRSEQVIIETAKLMAVKALKHVQIKLETWYNVGGGAKTRCWTCSDGKQKKKKNMTHYIEIWKAVIFVRLHSRHTCCY